MKLSKASFCDGERSLRQSQRFHNSRCSSRVSQFSGCCTCIILSSTDPSSNSTIGSGPISPSSSKSSICASCCLQPSSSSFSPRPFPNAGSSSTFDVFHISTAFSTASRSSGFISSCACLWISSISSSVITFRAARILRAAISTASRFSGTSTLKPASSIVASRDSGVSISKRDGITSRRIDCHCCSGYLSGLIPGENPTDVTSFRSSATRSTSSSASRIASGVKLESSVRVFRGILASLSSWSLLSFNALAAATKAATFSWVSSDGKDSINALIFAASTAVIPP
mmetsp:Transcript_25578/g.61630  ORF Transcript_25578/g.61630 Transcript_25578/m.61630 type:complete len:285 (-) Transcript_25578:678-1532(-)